MNAIQPNPSRNLLGLSRDELEDLAALCGQARYRGRQVYHAIYARREKNLAAITTLDHKFRDLLAVNQEIRYPEVKSEFVSRDGAIRYLLGLQDGSTIEAVYMPEENRTTLCLSSQVGCAVDCRFCFTALIGMKRNLSAGEIIGQVFSIAETRHIARGSRLNLVLMGMGEPLLNFGQVMKAIRILADPGGAGIPARRITLSTAGIIPGIRDLAREPVRPKLAVSLNASNDEQRTAIMPLNRKYNLKQLLEACRDFPLRPREHLTFEYVMLDGINDSNADAARVVQLVKGIRCKINLIPYNSGPELPYRASPLKRVLEFQEILVAGSIPTYIRISRGQDVHAACGQLSLAGANA
jgi:23S rRNA (adenine2503-C2)-methyltransferase